jgi:hypothetical protein
MKYKFQAKGNRYRISRPDNKSLFTYTHPKDYSKYGVLPKHDAQ